VLRNKRSWTFQALASSNPKQALEGNFALITHKPDKKNSFGD